MIDLSTPLPMLFASPGHQFVTGARQVVGIDACVALKVPLLEKRWMDFCAQAAASDCGLPLMGLLAILAPPFTSPGCEES
jgi:hypothetical protein